MRTVAGNKINVELTGGKLILFRSLGEVSSYGGHRDGKDSPRT